jgi:hypothetical protein
VFEQFGHRGEVGVQEKGSVLPLLGGQAGQVLGGVLQEGDEVLADWLPSWAWASVPAEPSAQSAARPDRAAPEIVRKVRRSIAVRWASLRAGTELWGPRGTTPLAVSGSQFGQSSARTMSAGQSSASAM